MPESLSKNYARKSKQGLCQKMKKIEDKTKKLAKVKAKKTEQAVKKVGKGDIMMRRWFKYFIDESSPITFLNRTESAIKAKCNCNTYNAYKSVCCFYLKKMKKKIDKWLDENGLSDTALKLKLLSLLNAKEKRFLSAPHTDKNGKFDIFVKEVESDALDVQRKTLEMALKVKGLYAPLEIKHEVRQEKQLEQEIIDRIDGKNV